MNLIQLIIVLFLNRPPHLEAQRLQKAQMHQTRLQEGISEEMHPYIAPAILRITLAWFQVYILVYLAHW